MQKNFNENVNKIDDEINQYIRENCKTIYKQESTDVGSRVNEQSKDKRHTNDGKFTKVIIFL